MGAVTKKKKKKRKNGRSSYTKFLVPSKMEQRIHAEVYSSTINQKGKPLVLKIVSYKVMFKQ